MNDFTAMMDVGELSPSAYSRAVLNILEDFVAEKKRLNDSKKAFQNILEDFGSERDRLEAMQRAVLNILDDLATEKRRLEETQLAVLRSEQAIRVSLKEKDLLLGEIHHRVKNNLQVVQSLLDMQASLTTDDGAARALRDSQNRIQSMALIHQTLYQSHDFAKVAFGVFLETLLTHLQNSYSRGDLTLSSRSDPVRLPIDRAIPCGLIVNELVTNALKHGFPNNRGGKVAVELRLVDGTHVEIAVTDDGTGIPDDFNLDSLASLGMQLVQVLSEQLDADLSIQRRDPTRIAFTFGKPCTGSI
ncbi:MAG: sensor histidine kinase [Panacagrimonas sp.]